MKVLLIGPDGFLGGHVAAVLRGLSAVQVLTAGRRAGHSLAVDLATVSAHTLAADLAALAPDVVVNCAGAVAGTAVRLVEVNARGPAALCEAMRTGAPGARLIHLGSAGEYGPCPPGTSLSESDPTYPVGVYGATKLAGSLAVAGCGLDAVVLRVFNPVGPGSPRDSLPGRLAEELYRVEPGGVVTVGDLSAHRDFVDARDVARAVGSAVLRTGPLPRWLNLAGGRARPVREIADGLVAVAGFTGRIDESGAGSARSSEVSWQQGDITAAARALGWEPLIPLADTLRDLWWAVAAAGTADSPDTSRSADEAVGIGGRIGGVAGPVPAAGA